MILTSTRLKRPINFAFYIILSTLITLNFSKSYAQRVYASVATVKSTVVENPNNAADASGSFATVRSYGGLALGLGKYSGELELQFPGGVPANKTTFIRIDFNADVLNALLGGNLGSDLANLTGTVVLGNHYFEVGARNSAGTTVLAGTSSGAFSNSNLRIVKDAAGAFYVSITPDQAYDRVYIKDNTAALLLGVNNETRVFNAFYTSGGAECDPAFATDFDGTGLTVGLLGIGKAGVSNMENAIDADPNSASEIGLGVIGVLGSISQNIYFNTASNPSDELNIKLQVNPTLVNAGLLNNIRIETFLGNVPISSHSASNLLNFDLLGLLTSGQAVRVGIAPGVAFDRVKITLTSLLNVSVTQNLNLFSVTRTPARPTFTGTQSNAITACYNSAATLSATTAAANQLVWYDVMDGGTALATTTSNGTYTTAAITGNKTYYVAALRPGCDESIRVPITVTVNPNLIFTTTTLNNGSVGSAYSKQINPATGGTPAYTYQLATGSTLPSGLAISSSGLISGTPTTGGTSNFNITATDSKNCTATTTFTLQVNSTLALGPATLPNGVVGTAYPAQTLPAATGGSTPYTYIATNVPPGLSFDPSTRAITGTPTTAGNYIITLRATDSQGNFVTRDYPITVTASTPSLTLASGALPDGTVGVNYPTQTLAAANGGTTPYNYSATGLPPGLSFNPTTREVTGIPTTSGNYTIVLTVTDTEARTATANYTVTINNGSGVVDCNAANSQTSGITGVCVLCSVTGPANSTDGDKLNFTRITLAVGVAASGFQVLNFATTGIATDNIKLDLATPTGLLDLSVLSGITVTVLNGNTIVNTYPLNSALISLQLLGGNRFTATVPAGGVFDRVELRFSATVAALSSLDIYGASIIYPRPTISTTGLAICSGSTSTLSATPNGGTTLAWFAAPTGGTALASGNTFITPLLTSTTTYYLEVTRAGCANPERIPVTIVVSDRPAAPIASVGNPTSACANTPVTLSVQQVAGITYRWFDTSGTQLGSTTNSYTTPANLAAGTYNFAVEAVNANSCSSSTRTTITLTVGSSAIASDIQVSGSTNVCSSSSTTLTASSTTVTNPTFTWYSNVALTNVVFTGAVFTTPVLTANTTYYVTVKGANKCENLAGSAAVINLTVGTTALASDIQVSGAMSVCTSSTTTLTASSTTVSNPVFTWYSNANLTTVVFTGSVFTTPALTAGTTYYVTVKGSNKCENAVGSAAVITLTVGTPALASHIQVSGSRSVCASSTVTLTASSATVTNPIFTWYSNANLTTVLFTGAIFTTPVLTANTTYYVTVKGSNKCENAVGTASVVALTINTQALASDVTISGSTSVCSSSNAVLTASSTTVTNPIFKWYSDANLTNSVFTGPIFTSQPLTANTNYYVTVSGDNKCENSSASAKAVAIVVNASPAAPVLSSTGLTTCVASATILTVQNPQAGVNYEFYSAVTGGTALFTGTSFSTPVLSANTDYYVQAVNASGCTNVGGRVKVTITVNIRPASPTVASATLSSCVGSTAVINISNPQAGVTYAYYSSATGGTSLGSGISFTTPALTATTTYYVEASSGACSSSTRTLVTVNVGTVLPAPVANVQSKTQNSIVFGWNAVSNATGYEISIDGGATWQNPSSGATGTIHLVSGLTAGQSVTFSVRAKGVASCQTSTNATPIVTEVNTLTDDLYIPNTFTPNGDGKNDVFSAYGSAVTRFKMRVYNQGGEFLSETNNLTGGWDGTYKGGMQPNGVYAYYIDVTFASGKTKMIKGTITLLR